jgi:hypothetical protein
LSSLFISSLWPVTDIGSIEGKKAVQTTSTDFFLAEGTTYLVGNRCIVNSFKYFRRAIYWNERETVFG